MHWLTPRLNSFQFHRIPGVVFTGKVIVAINANNDSKNINHTFLTVDNEENCLAINVYNLSLGKGPKIGDTVALGDPLAKLIEVRSEKEPAHTVIQYISLRVDNPLDLIVRGQRLNIGHLARPHIDNQLRRD